MPIRALLGLALAACGAEAPIDSPPPSAAGSATALLPGSEGDAFFVDRAAAAGLVFSHFNGMSGEYYMAEVTGAGVALFDYDGDDDLDVYLVQGTMLGPGRTLRDALFPPSDGLPLTDRLFRNDLEVDAAGVPALRFTDVTEESGIRAAGYGMGVATGDFDNDGWVDLYVTNRESNQLWRNLGDGTFRDVTATSGVDDSRWSVPAAFFDYDRDGWLDLFVGNYIAESFDTRPVCRDFTGAQDYCGPGSFRPEPDRLFRNRGDGSFDDVTAIAGLRGGFGGALGVATADFDGDGRLDVYVANDGLPNNLWVQREPGSFVDTALLAGCSVNAQGQAEASMGVDAADFDGDGDLDLFMAHLTGETNTLYLNDGTGVFDDHSLGSGLALPSRSFTSFGTAGLDYDNDGRLDLLVVNGAVKKIEALARARDPFPLHQTNQLFRNLGEGRFEEVTARAGEAFAHSEVSRGAAFGDLDNDGDLDVVINNNNGPARLLINEVGSSRPWVGLRLVDRSGRRDALHARVELLGPEGTLRWARARSAASFASANDPRVLVGLGTGPSPSGLRVHWPDGEVEEVGAPRPGEYTTLRQGEGRGLAEASQP